MMSHDDMNRTILTIKNRIKKCYDGPAITPSLQTTITAWVVSRSYKKVRMMLMWISCHFIKM